MRSTAEDSFAEREKRIADAIKLAEPDRVPICLRSGYFPAKYSGMTCEASFYDAQAWNEANLRCAVDYKPDAYESTVGKVSGPALEILGSKQVLWPGRGVPAHGSHQLLELETLKEDEYDAFLADPSDFAIRVYLPRIWGALEPFGELVPFRHLFSSTALASLIGVIDKPDFAVAFEILARAAKAASEWNAVAGRIEGEIAAAGVPSLTSLTTNAPFDVISDHLRGMRGTMTDMYRQPEKLLAACQSLVSLQADGIIRAAQRALTNRVFIPLHRGSDGFMSLRQFEVFYWPTLKELVARLVEAGLTPCPFFEGFWNARLEYLLELPKGKVLCHFAQTDMARAKKVLGGHVCIMGNVPASLLQLAGEQEVRDYCKTLIDSCAPGGGFILSHMPIDDAKPENVRVMVEFTKEYGVYAR